MTRTVKLVGDKAFNAGWYVARTACEQERQRQERQRQERERQVRERQAFKAAQEAQAREAAERRVAAEAQRAREALALEAQQARVASAAAAAAEAEAAAQVPELVMWDLPVIWPSNVRPGQVVWFDDDELGRFKVTAPPNARPGGEYTVKGVPSTEDPRAHARAASEVKAFLERRGLARWVGVFTDQLDIKTVLQLHELTANELAEICDPKDISSVLGMLVPEGEYSVAPGA